MSIVQTRTIIHCDEPGCAAMVELRLYPEHRTVTEALSAVDWQPWLEKDYCPEHKRNAEDY